MPARSLGSRFALLPLLVLALTGCCLVVVGVAATGPAAAASGEGTGPGKMLLVLDSSGSMKEPDAAGQRKIDAAKQALRTVVGRLPDEQPVGLRVFGAKVFSSKDAGACTDSQLRVPVDTGNRGALLSAIASYKPYGETPIGYALQQAAKDLGSEGKRSIVLVSDGEPTCQPDPCVVARQLSRGGIDLKIDVVGLDVDEQARRALQCIADKGHGTYYDVGNAHDLSNSLVKVATRAARPYTAIGTPVTGGTDAAGAPELTNGDWLAQTTGETAQYFRITRQHPGSTVMFSAATRDPEANPINKMEISTADGTGCMSTSGTQVLGKKILVSIGVVAGQVSSAGTPRPDDDPCTTADSLIAVFHYGAPTKGVPIELRVTELPKVSNLDALPAPSTASYHAPRGRPAGEVLGGTSFDDAPTLDPGTYRGTVVQGETLTYRVHLDWGQSLSVALSYPKLDAAHADAVKGRPYTQLGVYNPARLPVANADSTETTSGSFLDDQGRDYSFAAGPVAFRNAQSAGDSGANLAGDYTVTVYLGKTEEGRSIPIPFTLGLGISGAVAGAPEFATAPVSPESSAPSTDAAPGPSTHRDPQPASSDEGGSPWVPVLGGLVLLALVAGGAVLWRSRRDAPSA